MRSLILGLTDNRLSKRLGTLVVSFLALFYSVTIASHFLLPEGALRGKHPIIANMRLPEGTLAIALQILTYNMMPLSLIVLANLLAQQSRLYPERFIPMGYLAMLTLTVICATVLGTWSFEVVTEPPSLLARLIGMLDITKRSGLLELFAYLLAAASSFRLTRWFADSTKILKSLSWRELSLPMSDRLGLTLSVLLLVAAAWVEAVSISATVR